MGYNSLSPCVLFDDVRGDGDKKTLRNEEHRKKASASRQPFGNTLIHPFRDKPDSTGGPTREECERCFWYSRFLGTPGALRLAHPGTGYLVSAFTSLSHAPDE